LKFAFVSFFFFFALVFGQESMLSCLLTYLLTKH